MLYTANDVGNVPRACACGSTSSSRHDCRLSCFTLITTSADAGARRGQARCGGSVRGDADRRKDVVDLGFEHLSDAPNGRDVIAFKRLYGERG